MSGPSQIAKANRDRLFVERAVILDEEAKRAVAVRANMARLRELRLAKEAQEVRTEISPGNQPTKSKTEKAVLIVGALSAHGDPEMSAGAEGQAAAMFLIAPMMAVSMAPPAPPAIACETTSPILRLPDSAAATTEGSNRVTIWPSTPPPTKPEITLPAMPRSKVGDDLPAPTPPSAPAMRLIKICSIC